MKIFRYETRENLCVANAGKKIPGGSEKSAKRVKNHPDEKLKKTLDEKHLIKKPLIKNYRQKKAPCGADKISGELSDNFRTTIDIGIYQSGIFATTYRVHVVPCLQSWLPG